MRKMEKAAVVLLAALTVVCTANISTPLVLAGDATDINAASVNPLSYEADPEQVLELVVRTIDENQLYRLPTANYQHSSSRNNIYDWLIDWGDGSSEVAQGQSSYNSGVLHYYEKPGDYIVSIRPNGSAEAWLAAFGNISVYRTNSQGTRLLTGDNMVVAVLSPLRPEMMRTTDQINGSAPPPDYEWAYTFNNYFALTEAPVFVGYDSITTVGHLFALNMFSACENLVTLPEGFNLPQNITEAGYGFASYMFSFCENLTALPGGFNLPQNIATVDEAFAEGLFYESGGSSFQINDEFMLPASIPSDSSYSFSESFQLSESAPMQLRSATSIIGVCPLPSDERFTFDSHFTDIDFIPVNWGGKVFTPPPVTGLPGSGDYDGDGFVTMFEVMITVQAAMGEISINPDQFAALDMDNDGYITMADVIMVYQMAIL